MDIGDNLHKFPTLSHTIIIIITTASVIIFIIIFIVTVISLGTV